MENERLNLFELHYTWYEHEHQSTILATQKEQNKIEEDLKEAATSIEFDQIKEKAAIYKDYAYRRICVIRLLFPFNRIIRFIILNLRFHLPDESLLWRLKNLKIQTSMRPYLIVP